MWLVSIYFKRNLKREPVTIMMEELTGSLEWHLGKYPEDEISTVTITRG